MNEEEKLELQKRKRTSLLAHLQHHDAKGWLLEGCNREDAQTIRKSVQEMPSHRLNRRLARLLSK